MSILSNQRISICNKNFRNYEDVAKHMRILFAKYVKNTGVIDKDILIKSLKSFKDGLMHEKNYGAYDNLLKENFPYDCLNLMKLCMETDDAELLTSLFSCIITITDNSLEMCIELTKNGLCELIIKQTIKVCDYAEKTKLHGLITRESMFDQLILIVDNIVNDPQFSQIFLQSKDIHLFKNKIITFMESEYIRTRILTMTALTYLIGDETYNLHCYYTIINDFVECIKIGMNDETRRYEGLRISELLVVLRFLANIESIKNAMLGMNNVMTLLTNLILSDKTTPEEMKRTAAVLYNLSFRNVSAGEGRQQNIRIQDLYDVEIIIKRLSEYKDKEIQNCVDSLKSELTNKKKIYDIFISCYKDDKDKMSKIADILTEKGFKVLNYQDKATESDVKSSIKESRVIIMGVSNSYYNDQNCRVEGQYAYTKEKLIIPIIMEPVNNPKDWLEYNPKDPREYCPEDWLEKIIRNEIRFDFSSMSEFDSLITKLLKLIGIIFDRPGVGKECQTKLSSDLRTVGVSKSYQKNKNIKEWNKEEVAQWLQDNELSNIMLNSEVKYDGKMIEYMRVMRSDSNEQYLKRLRDYLKLSFDDEIKFDCALENFKT